MAEEQCTLHGTPIGEHLEIDPKTGMQKDYVVICDDHRDPKKFVRPVRRTYLHLKCGTKTTMGQALSETYAMRPSYYSHTMCVHCRGHFPVGAEDGEFVWMGENGIATEEKVGT